MKAEEYAKLDFNLGQIYTIKSLPKGMTKTWKALSIIGKTGEVVKIGQYPYKREIVVTLKIENPLKMLFADNFWYLEFSNEDVFKLERVVESKKKPKELPLKVEFDLKDQITTLKTGKEEIKVKTHKDDKFDEEKGVLLCLAKLYGYSYEDIKKLVTNAKKTGYFKFNIDDIVKVNDPDYCYDSYKELVEKCFPLFVKNFTRLTTPNVCETYIIKGATIHPRNGEKVYLIKDIRDRVFLISECALYLEK